MTTANRISWISPHPGIEAIRSNPWRETVLQGYRRIAAPSGSNILVKCGRYLHRKLDGFSIVTTFVPSRIDISCSSPRCGCLLPSEGARTP